MTTMTLTEFNQNPSRVVRLMEGDARSVIRVTKRGLPLFQVTAISCPDDPVGVLIAKGLATAPDCPSRQPVAYGSDTVPAGLDLLADLERDRKRLV